MTILKIFPEIKNLHGRKVHIVLHYGKIYIGSTLFLLLSLLPCYSLQPTVEGIPPRFGQEQYAVVIDAGSTGSRTNAYKFQTSQSNGRLILDKGFQFAVNPGLSSYQEPQKAAQSIEKLLVEAKTFVPRELSPSTPLVLKATAGLRMLPSDLAHKILNAVRSVIFHSGFLVPENAVEIMDGIDEGIFSWLTVNILSGKLDSVNLGNDTLAALDLGGGSTQVTFDVKDPSLVPSLADSMHTISTSEAKLNVFTNSYSKLGLQALRHAVFTSGKTTDDITYVSECINPSIKSANFTYAAKTYFVSGKTNSPSTGKKPTVDLDACINLINEKSMPLVSPKPITLNEINVVAFSYFIARAIESKIVPESGGEVTVGQYLEKAKEICAQTTGDHPFMCLDLLYISTLLTNGYGLNADKKINLHNKIDGQHVNWALGCAYSLLGDISRDKRPIAN